MNVLRGVVIGSCVAIACSAVPALASDDRFGYLASGSYDGPLPPEGFAQRRWEHPNGCKYSRAGRRGERVWYLIINSVGEKNCVRYFVESANPADTSVTRSLYRYDY